MKLRLQSQSIRLRLKRSEVDQLARTGRVEEEVVLGLGVDGSFRYVLESSPSISELQVHLQTNTLFVEVPEKTVSLWASSEEVGMEASVPVKNQGEVQVLIEKDFACLNGPEEENVDTFPNPLAGSKC